MKMTLDTDTDSGATSGNDGDCDAERSAALAILTSEEQRELDRWPIGSEKPASTHEQLRTRQAAAQKYEQSFLGTADASTLNDTFRAVYQSCPRYRFYSLKSNPKMAVRIFGIIQYPDKTHGFYAISVGQDGNLCESLDGISADDLDACVEWDPSHLAGIKKSPRPDIFLDPFGWVLCVK